MKSGVRTVVIRSLASLGLLLAFQATWAADAEVGKKIYQSRCAVCHSVDANNVGPAHKGVFGRRVGQAPDFAYSPALRASTVVWNEKTLNQWLTNPEALIPGQKMAVSVASDKERAHLIAYLKKLSAK